MIGETSSVVSDMKTGIAKCWLCFLVCVLIELAVECRSLALARQTLYISSASFVFFHFVGQTTALVYGCMITFLVCAFLGPGVVTKMHVCTSQL